MSPGPGSGEPSGPDLEAELRAERAATDHWRRVARQRAGEYAALRHRWVVRALLAVERRLEPLLSAATSARRRVGAGLERLALRAGALSRGARGVAIPVAHGTAPELPALARGHLVLVVVGAPADTAPSADGAATVLRVADATEVGRAIDTLIATDAPDLVGLVATTSQPASFDWLRRLAGACGGSVVAATPVLVHPRRPWASATRDDGQVRSAGLSIALRADGTPVVAARSAGTAPNQVPADVDVAAASGAAVVFDRRAYEAAGGLRPDDDLDVAVVELCARLRAHGGRVVVVPSSIVVDHRPVRSRRALAGPVDPAGSAWTRAIERSGPLLRRSAGAGSGLPTFALTVAAPSAKVASRWGDWHLADGLARGLRALDHSVVLQTADRGDALGGRACDVHVVLRGLRRVRATPGQRQVLWVISHPEDIEDDELNDADLVLVASPRFAEHLQRRTATPVEVLLQATDHHRFGPRPPSSIHRHDVTIVAKTRDVVRPVVSDALAAGLRPAVYGGGWQGLIDPALIVADHVEHAHLPVVYSSAGVVLNDHWRTMGAWGFVSNRIFDVLACGTPVISDPVPGLAALFAGAVPEYHSPEELRTLVGEALTDPPAARTRAERGRQIVLSDHTLDHRAAELLACLDRYDLLD